MKPGDKPLIALAIVTFIVAIMAMTACISPARYMPTVQFGTSSGSMAPRGDPSWTVDTDGWWYALEWDVAMLMGHKRTVHLSDSSLKAALRNAKYVSESIGRVEDVLQGKEPREVKEPTVGDGFGTAESTGLAFILSVVMAFLRWKRGVWFRKPKDTS